MARKELRAARRKAKSEVGVLLPDIDPSIGEMVLTTLYANPNHSMSEIALGLIDGAPHPEVAKEILDAIFELALCATKGELIWLQDSGQSILAGTRRAVSSAHVYFGGAKWPMKALVMGPPIRHVVRMHNAVREIWMAGDLQGAVVKQTEAVAIGNATVERFGGRVIEDRMGPDVMRQSFLEGRHTDRAKLRAQALDSLDRVTTTAGERDQDHISITHQRMALAEALPGTMESGLEIYHEDYPDHIFRVERRVNQSWVQIVALREDTPVIPEGVWYRRDGRPPTDTWEMDDNYCGFTDYPTRSGRMSGPEANFVGQDRGDGDLPGERDPGSPGERGSNPSDGGLNLVQGAESSSGEGRHPGGGSGGPADPDSGSDGAGPEEDEGQSWRSDHRPD